MIRIRGNFLSFINKQLIPFFIVFIFLIFLSNIFPEFLFENSEFQLLEIIQNILLICSLVLLFKFRKQFVKVSNLFTYLLRQLFILFILYEELSFLTFNNYNLTNSQQEFNFHNSNLFNTELFSLTIPITNLTYTPTILTLLSLSILFIFGYGSYFSCFKKIRYFFLEKQYAIYTFIYAANVKSISILFDLDNNSNIYLIKGEVLELFFYLLICIDTLKKRKIMSENRVIE